MTDHVGGDTFEAGWLDLREPVDHRSRTPDLVERLMEAWTEKGWRNVVDLGCGTGSNVRFLTPLLPGPQSWTLVDHDAGHLPRARTSAGQHPVHAVVGDLADGGLTALDGADLVTCSALLDLVTEAWMNRLIQVARSQEAGVYLCLSYDGTVEWSAPDELDERVRQAVNEHQRSDKGMGPALGPTGGAVARRILEESGYDTHVGPSPWQLDRGDAALARSLIRGWADAAGELDPSRAASYSEWAERRSADVETGRTTLTVGHVDVLGLPPARP